MFWHHDIADYVEPIATTGWVQLVGLEERVLVYYYRTHVGEVDLAIQRSTDVERWIEE
jgi:hypothetical protein